MVEEVVENMSCRNEPGLDEEGIMSARPWMACGHVNWGGIRSTKTVTALKKKTTET
jgi:hypothetical protein